MPFGAYETMVVHEILDEKVNIISHFGLYASQAQQPALRQMVERHLQSAVQSYNQLVAYTHDYIQVQSNNKMHQIMSAEPQQIQYGLHQPAPIQPQSGSSLNDQQIAAGLLSCHKNSSKNQMIHALEYFCI
jgi:spore coat protein CotF